jgi:hypothetical protein
MLDPFLGWLEMTALSQWVVGSPSLFAFPGILSVHAVGMALAVGVSIAFDLRILGVTSRMPLAEMRRYLPVFWTGFWLNAVSGVLLLVGYPTKALTNPVFYLKLGLIGVAMTLMVRLARADGVPQTLQRRMAILSLLCWMSAIFAGRLLAYTYNRMTVFE